MNKPTRIITAILVTLMLGSMFAYQDIQKNEATYQLYPVTVVLTDFFCGFLAGLIGYFGSGWFAKRKKKQSNQAYVVHPKVEEKFIDTKDEKFYEEVAREMQEKPLSAGLWTKAFAEVGGDDVKTRALYIKYRVAQLKEDKRKQLEEERRKWAAKEIAEWQQRTPK